MEAFCDPDRTKQILVNLIDNALKYTPEGGKVEVKLSLSGQGNSLLIAVEDNGVGISTEHISKLFGKFQRINNPLSDKVSGYGLGLFITKSLVEQQGGRIWVSSTLGEGSKFVFTLPLDLKQEYINSNLLL
jgi:signal transduction histidine kinase